ncbi:MAG: penicillin-binding protein 2 [Acidimicrobiales bacterium]|nr:penicillin-binding protein 2 [Acidimicrobiales bacterium]MCB9392895.1 penicillin-binding protein 2 [Acidimicrobiaceae bacterium]
MNTRIRRLAVGLLVCYLALFVQLNLLQVQREEELTSDPRNDRQTIRDFNRPRGDIITADGVVLARSVRIDEPDAELKYRREYPTGSLFGNITGYFTFSYGSTQLEREYSDVLAGTTREQQVKALGDLFTGQDVSGSVVLTMRADVQQAARDALVDPRTGLEREGSVVVIDPSTGAVIAMYSSPTYDPNQVVTGSNQDVNDVFDFLNNYPGKPLLANTYQERYMPGSAFKVITTGIALENGTISLDSRWPNETEWTPPQTTDPIQNYDGSSCGGSLVEVFFRSCNIPFAQMAVDLGPEAMVAGTKAWGIGERLPIDLPGPVASSFGEVDDFTEALPLLAIGGFGQGNDVMVPLHMAMVAATVANGGRMMAPHVVDVTRYQDDTVLDRTDPEVWKTPISPTTAATLNTLMVGVVNNGTGRQMQLANGIQAAAKTGTAQLNAAGEPERSHAWIIGFAPAEQPRYAIAVMLKGTNDEISAGTGGRLAGPIAKQVLDFVFATEANTVAGGAQP